MIFVVTGVHEHGFNRLVKAVDELADAKRISNVFIQTGFSSYQPRYCKWIKSIDFLEFEKRMDEADVIITHGGAGCIAGALERNKPTIVVPRLKRFNEHNNDHQIELTSVLEKSGRVLAVYDIKELPKAIEKAVHFRPAPPAGKNQILKIIRQFLIAEARRKGIELNTGVQS